jgi:hypothetical protein
MGFMRRGNYENNTIEIVVDHVRHTIRSEMEHLQFEGKTVEESAKIAQIILASTARRELILEGRCFVGITANPMQSLSAHGINIFTSNTFFCMDIPKEDAAICKEAVMALEGYESVSNSETDCYETPFSQLYLYIYKITELTNENPEIKEMVPLQTLPEREITIRKENRDGTANAHFVVEMNEPVCDELLMEIHTGISKHQLADLRIRHRDFNQIIVQFGDDCCIISYDAGTSQCGGYQSYRSGSTSRKKVQLYSGEYPEYMICRDMQALEEILRYFLLKGKKPGKRQNVKWVNMKYDD